MIKNFHVMLDDCTKGIPAGTSPFPIDEIRNKGWNVLAEDLTLPVALLKQRDIQHNSTWMQTFLAAGGAQIAPHGKTTMSPELFNVQMEDGAWGITLATAHQVQVARKFGFRRIFFANQLIGKTAIAGVLNEIRNDPTFEFYCITDSLVNVAELARAAAKTGLTRPLNVLVELGYQGGRTGCRTLEEALSVARGIAAGTGRLALAGVEGFEGLMRGKTAGESKAMVDAYLSRLVDLAEECETAGLFATRQPIISAGGSQYYDLVVDQLHERGIASRFLLLLRSGCYLTHDSGLYRRAFEQLRERNPALAAAQGGLRPALEVWAYVQSRPEDRKAIINFGKRDASHDDPPVALSWYRPSSAMSAPQPIGEGYRVSRLNDQHCHLEIPAESPLAVGDMIAFGISHPCLTFDKWRALYVVDETYQVVSAISTYF